MKGNVSHERQFVRQLIINAVIYLLCHPPSYLSLALLHPLSFTFSPSTHLFHAPSHISVCSYHLNNSYLTFAPSYTYFLLLISQISAN